MKLASGNLEATRIVGNVSSPEIEQIIVKACCLHDTLRESIDSPESSELPTVGPTIRSIAMFCGTGHPSRLCPFDVLRSLRLHVTGSSGAEGFDNEARFNVGLGGIPALLIISEMTVGPQCQGRKLRGSPPRIGS